MFLAVITVFNLVVDFMMMIGSAAWSDVSLSFIVDAIILIYVMLPGTKRAFGTAKQKMSWVGKSLLTRTCFCPDPCPCHAADHVSRSAACTGIVPRIVLADGWRHPCRVAPIVSWVFCSGSIAFVEPCPSSFQFTEQTLLLPALSVFSRQRNAHPQAARFPG
jgi:hypothetical protein